MTTTAAGPKLYSYVMTSDRGFAPNRDNEYCTLACCKPVIRRVAKVGDWVIGTAGSKMCVENGRLIYAMRITEKLNFVQYSKAVRFKDRKDNIYALDENNAWKQWPNQFHGIKHTNHDLSGVYVLISTEFYYLKNGVQLKGWDDFRELIPKGRQYKMFDSDNPERKRLIDDFIKWLKGNHDTDILGPPINEENKCQIL